MSETLEDVLVARAQAEPRGLSRTLAWSTLVHVTALVAVVAVPRAWFTRPKETPLLISVNLGGTPGPKTTGMAPLAGRNVEPPPTPPPPKPEPPRPPPPAPKEPDLAKLMNRIITQPSKPSDSTRPAPVSKPPTPVAPSRGDARADTASKTEGTGLSSGGGAGSERMSFDPSFCCMPYALNLVSQIDAAWRKTQPERGVTTMRFEIRRDGSVVNISVEQSSGSLLLDRAAQSAVTELANRKAPPLPAEYKENTLVFHLKFPYGG